MTSVPSATAQAWHSDGGDPGMFNVFVPLVPLTRCNGPTHAQEKWPLPSTTTPEARARAMG